MALCASVAAVGVGNSADLPVPPLAPVQDFSGWYLRGDIGFSNQQVDSLFNANYSRFYSVNNIDKGFDAAPFFGLGVGYNVNIWLRFDVTEVDYTGTDFDVPFELRHVTSHDLKLGVRYKFGGYDYLPLPPLRSKG